MHAHTHTLNRQNFRQFKLKKSYKLAKRRNRKNKHKDVYAESQKILIKWILAGKTQPVCSRSSGVPGVFQGTDNDDVLHVFLEKRER